MDLQPLRRHLRIHLAALGFSALYGLAIRVGIALSVIDRLGQRFPSIKPWLTNGIWVMTVAFLFLVPFAMGYLAVAAYCELQHRAGYKPSGLAFATFYPWIPTAAMLVIATLAAWEGMICVLFASPAMFIMASIGGLAAHWAGRRRFHPAQLSAIALLPVVLTFLEARLPEVDSLRTVETDVVIHAPLQAVWRNVIRVPSIHHYELPDSWVQRIGFPRPVEATLSHEGIGGVRRASFTGGLLFTETIDHWDPMRQISFSIHADTDQIPLTTLDEHARVGGQYFDVLEGEYRLESQPDGSTLLRLISRERVSTHFNPYAGMWTDAVMRSIQSSILDVIRNRAEHDNPQSIFAGN